MGTDPVEGPFYVSPLLCIMDFLFCDRVFLDPDPFLGYLSGMCDSFAVS